MTDWVRVIRAMTPRARGDIVDGLADLMDRIISEFEISTPLRQAHFLAQCAHESDGFQTTMEYASGAAYEGRKDLGNIKKGDGRRFKGHGLIQTTGRANHKKVSERLGVDFVANPEMLGQMPYAALSAAVFWEQNHLNTLADRDDVRSVTRRVNGGYNGLQDRTAYLAKAKAAIAQCDNFPDEGPVPPARPDDLDHAEPIPREKVRALQERLTSLGYRCGTIDGLIGTATVAAISAFQHDNAIPITGRIDAVTEEKLWHSNTEAKPVPTARAEGQPEESRIVDAANVLKKGAGAITVGSGAVAAADPLKQIQGVGNAITQFQYAISPFKPILNYAQDHWYILVVVAALGVWLVANQIKQARVDDHRSGKTL